MLGDVNNHIINGALWNCIIDMPEKALPSLPPLHVKYLFLKGDKEKKGSKNV